MPKIPVRHEDDSQKDKDETPPVTGGTESLVRPGAVVPVDISHAMRTSYLDYAMSVIVSRALPDVRDGLKPVHRRILYSLEELGLSSSAKFRKSALIVGDVLGKYHPHGDSSVYDTMVKMAQDFSFRYPLVIGQGNFGSIDGDPPAAYRYTEAKMSKLAEALLKDLKKETVNYVPNYDGTRKEPTVLPAAFPNLLANGTLGIAVGMATNIPPHNLRELIDATTHLIDNPEATTEDLLQFVKGPDFPTGGYAFGTSDIKHAYATGRGGVVCRGHAEIVEGKAGQYQIIISSVPYRVNKAELIMKIADLVHEKKIDGIKGLRDESAKDIRVAVDIKAGAQPQKVLNAIYKHTELESTFNYNMVALVDGVPQTLALKTMLAEFVKHRKEVITRRTEHELRKAQERAHILEGLKKALDHIDEVIKIIKASKDTPTAHANLMAKFKFSEIQATAILEMRLQKLAGLERKQIEDELEEKRKLIAYYEGLLKDVKKLMGVVKTELLETREAFGDERKTTIVKSGAKIMSPEDLVEEKNAMLVLTKGGYVKRTDPSEYKAQKRGGVGVVDMNTKEEDFVTAFVSASTHSDILFFTDKGKVYQLKMYELPEGRRATKGKAIVNFLQLADGENVSSVLPMPKEMRDMEGLSLMMLTKQGTSKRVKADSFKDVRRNGLIAINLADGDELLSVLPVHEKDTVIVVSAAGKSIRFEVSDIREMGRTAAGVRAMTLAKGDVIVGAGIVRDEKHEKLLVVGAGGYGKKTELSEYKIQKRGGSGILTAQITAKTGKLIGASVIDEEIEEIIAMSKKGQVIRTATTDIPTLGRQTQGVRIMKMREGDAIASVVCLNGEVEKDSQE
ncbi:MAG: DNA gyrase subunit A [Candidatus Yonathbacteria bacterium]|nr:DNA gyrase subunit A [Candidatus Yonathbacteria bacterium]NTW48043.1 DNA gyrase subunit A [Candidatus Yonathbacteria bacterium]